MGKGNKRSWAVIFSDAGAEPRHPSQIYEALGEGLFLGLAMGWIRSRSPKPTGQVIAAFFLIYGVVRIGLEFFREPDAGDPVWAGLSRGQYFSVGLVIISFGLWLWRRRGTNR